MALYKQLNRVSFVPFMFHQSNDSKQAGEYLKQSKD